MNISGKYTIDNYGTRNIGELNLIGRLSGKGIAINKHGIIRVGNFLNGDMVAGNYILIFALGSNFQVGEYYFEAGG